MSSHTESVEEWRPPGLVSASPSCSGLKPTGAFSKFCKVGSRALALEQLTCPSVGPSRPLSMRPRVSHYRAGPRAHRSESNGIRPCSQPLPSSFQPLQPRVICRRAHRSRRSTPSRPAPSQSYPTIGLRFKKVPAPRVTSRTRPRLPKSCPIRGLAV